MCQQSSSLAKCEHLCLHGIYRERCLSIRFSLTTAPGVGTCGMSDTSFRIVEPLCKAVVCIDLIFLDNASSQDAWCMELPESIFHHHSSVVSPRAPPRSFAPPGSCSSSGFIPFGLRSLLWINCLGVHLHDLNKNGQVGGRCMNGW